MTRERGLEPTMAQCVSWHTVGFWMKKHWTWMVGTMGCACVVVYDTNLHSSCAE